MKKYDSIAVVRSEQTWRIYGDRENVVQLLQNICTIPNEHEKRKYNLRITGYIEKQAKMHPSVTQLASIYIEIGQFVSFHDRFDGVGIRDSYALLHATFDQTTEDDEWSKGTITFPLYEVINTSGNKNFNVMAPFEKVIERWQNIILNNIANDGNIVLGNRTTSFSIVGMNSILQDFLSNVILDGIIANYKEAEIDNMSDDKDKLEVYITLPTENTVLLEQVVRGNKEFTQKFCVGNFEYDMNNEIEGMNRIFFEFVVTEVAFNEDGETVDIAENNLSMANAMN